MTSTPLTSPSEEGTKCPDPNLCAELCRHVHGRVYELYVTDERFRSHLRREAMPPPSLARKAVNFSKAAFVHIVDGLTTVDESSYRIRLEMCGNCEIYDQGKEVCKHMSCGCYMPTKAWWRTSKCPLAKWPEDTSGEGGSPPS